MSEQATKKILDNLIEEADRLSLYCTNDPKKNAEKVGKLVQDLTAADRELLATLMSNDIQDMRPFNKYYRRK